MQLLEQLGIDLSFLSLQYKCNNCKNTGYVMHNSQTTMCTCLKQKIFNEEYNKANIGNLSKDTFENFNINLFSNEVNKQNHAPLRKSLRRRNCFVQNRFQYIAFYQNIFDRICHSLAPSSLAASR